MKKSLLLATAALAALGFGVACSPNTTTSQPSATQTAQVQTVQNNPQPTNPLGGAIYLASGKTMGTADKKVWICEDLRGDEWECSNFSGMTSEQASRWVEEANARNSERAQLEQAREELRR